MFLIIKLHFVCMYVLVRQIFLSIITTRVFELRHAKIASFLIFVKFISVNMLTKAKYPFGQNTGQSREFITQPSYQYVRMIICPAVCGWPHKSFRRAQITHNRFSKRSALLRFPFHHREKFALETNSLGWLGEKDVRHLLMKIKVSLGIGQRGKQRWVEVTKWR